MSNTSAIFKAKRKQLTLKYLEYCVELDQLEKECPHQDLTYKYGGSSGNWDKSDDKYWIDWKCHDCGKSWTTSQDNTWHLTRKVYPQAKQVK